MSKRNSILALTLIVVVSAILLCSVYFFMPESPLAVKYYPPSCDPSKTDCSKFTPDGTPFVRPPEPVQATTTQAGQIDEHLFIDNTLRDVNFCGKMYRVKQVFIDGVDVVQQVAKLVTKDLVPKNIGQGKFAWATCENIYLNNSSNLSTENLTPMHKILEVNVFPNTNIERGVQTTYLVSAPGFHVVVNSLTNEIFDFSDFDGSLVGPLGKLK